MEFIGISEFHGIPCYKIEFNGTLCHYIDWVLLYCELIPMSKCKKSMEVSVIAYNSMESSVVTLSSMEPYGVTTCMDWVPLHGDLIPCKYQCNPLYKHKNKWKFLKYNLEFNGLPYKWNPLYNNIEW